MNFFKQMNSRTAAAAAVTAAVLVPLGVFGAPALARTASSADAYQYQYKVLVCHKTHSKKHPWHVINIAAAAVPAHLKHGDFVVTTTAVCPPPKPATTATTSVSGQSGNHGNNGNHGNGNNGKGKGK